MRLTAKGILKRGDFYFFLLAALLYLNLSFWKNLTLDIQLYDTYYVFSYSEILIPFILYFGICGLIYSLYYFHNYQLNHSLVLIHVVGSVTSMIIIFTQLFGLQIAHSTRYYTYYAQQMEELRNAFIPSMLCILFFFFCQVLFVTNLCISKNK